MAVESAYGYDAIHVQGELAEERREAKGGRGPDITPRRSASEAHVCAWVVNGHSGQGSTSCAACS